MIAGVGHISSPDATHHPELSELENPHGEPRRWSGNQRRTPAGRERRSARPTRLWKPKKSIGWRAAASILKFAFAVACLDIERSSIMC